MKENNKQRFTIRVERDGRIIAVLNTRANHHDASLLGFSLEEGHFSIHPEYMHRHTKRLDNCQQSAIYRECIANGWEYAKRINANN